MNTAGFRLIGNILKNQGREEAQTHTYCYLLDPNTAVPLALVDEFYQHILRTGVCTAVTLSYLAKRDSETVGIIGSGKIAGTTIHGIASQFNIRKLKVYSRTEDSRNRFATQMQQELGIESEAVDDPELVIRNSDIAVTISSADAPIVKKSWIDPGCTLCSTGGNQELDPGVLEVADKLVVDDFQWCTMAGDIHAWIERSQYSRDDVEKKVYADIGSISNGAKPGRVNDSERIVAVIQGIAVCDLSLARYVYDKLKDSPEVQRIEI
jgi:ornithine cyclodeaminase/alanine dehydrogenase-like protein (mu-crystallin family)